MIDVSRLCVWLTILVVIFVPLERVFAIHPKKIRRKQLGIDLGYYFLNSLIPATLLSVPIGLFAWSVHRIMPGGLLASLQGMPLWARLIGGMVAGEIGYYWGHRWSHEIPFLWDFHAVHHSAEEVDFLVNTRAHPLDLVVGRFCGLVPIYLLGLGGPAGSTVPVLVTVIGTVWGFFIHANLRWRFGPVEWLIATPAFHHWHHTREAPIDKNYSATFPWVDRLFGTYHLPNEWPESYGIRTKLPETMVGQLTYPLFSLPAEFGDEESSGREGKHSLDKNNIRLN